MATLLLSAFPLAALWLAVRLVRDLAPAERGVVLAGAALAAGSGLLAPSLPQNDAWTHFLHLRAALDEPARLLDAWDRPGFTLLYAAPAALGIHAARLVSAVLAALAAAATVRAARALALPHPWLAGLFLLAQHDVFGQAGSTMTELPFAAALAVALAALLERRPWVAAVALGWCAITRPEGPLYAALGAAWLLARERRPGPPLVALAAFPLYVLAGAVAFGDALWLVNANPYRGLVGHRFELDQLWRSWFFGALRLGQPLALLALEAAGAAAVLRGRPPLDRLRAHGLLLLAPLAVSYVLLTFLRIGPSDAWRESRYLVTVAPALALLALAGLDAVLEALPRAAPPLLLALAAWSATWTVAWHWAPGPGAAPLDASLASAILAGLAALLGAAAPRAPARAGLALLLWLPLAAVPPGAWAKHRPGQTPGGAASGGAAPVHAPAPER